jgi:hypothetical protein
VSKLPSRPPGSKPARPGPACSLRLAFPPFAGNPGVFQVTEQGKGTWDYWFLPVPADQGLAWKLERIGTDPAEGPFVVTIDPVEDRRECSCLRFLRTRQCLHCSALWALWQSGELKGGAA